MIPTCEYMNLLTKLLGQADETVQAKEFIFRAYAFTGVRLDGTAGSFLLSTSKPITLPVIKLMLERFVVGLVEASHPADRAKIEDAMLHIAIARDILAGLESEASNREAWEAEGGAQAIPKPSDN